MMSDIREQAAAAKAAREWREKQPDKFDTLHDIGEAAVAIGYAMGHAAGVADGARAFAEFIADYYAISGADTEWLDKWLASRPAPGTGLASKDTEKED